MIGIAGDKKGSKGREGNGGSKDRMQIEDDERSHKEGRESRRNRGDTDLEVGGIWIKFENGKGKNK